MFCFADEVVVAGDIGSELLEGVSVLESGGLFSGLLVDFVEGVAFDVVVDYLAESAHNNFIIIQGCSYIASLNLLIIISLSIW